MVKEENLVQLFLFCLHDGFQFAKTCFNLVIKLSEMSFVVEVSGRYVWKVQVNFFKLHWNFVILPACEQKRN